MEFVSDWGDLYEQETHRINSVMSLLDGSIKLESGPLVSWVEFILISENECNELVCLLNFGLFIDVV